MKRWILLAWVALIIGNARGDTLFSEDFEKGIGKRWEPVRFEEMTEYTTVKEGDTVVMRAHAQTSASGLAAKFNYPVRGSTTLSWRWKIDKTPAGGSEDAKKTFDHTARIFIAFKTLVGPPRTINYVWANKYPVGKIFDHPSSSRAKFIVLESGDAKAGQWVKYSRNLLQDWRMLFGEDGPPNIVGIGIMTDSDGTKSDVTGCYDDLLITGEAK